MHYIIKIDTVRLLVSNENDARNLVSSLLSTKIVNSNYKYGNEKFTIQEDYSLEIKSIESGQIIDPKVKTIRINSPASFPDGTIMDKDDVSPI